MTKNYLPGAEPVFLEGKEKGLLLLHGAGGGCAWDLKEFATEAHKKGFTVLLPTLSGFGTTPEELRDITFDKWLIDTRKGLEHLHITCSSVSIVGHSIGGLLTLILAAQEREISRVVCWAAPWKINNRILPFVPLLASIPILRRLIPKDYPTNIPTHLKEKGWVGYDWIPSSLGFVVLDALKQLHSSISKITCPVFIIQGSKDEAISPNSAQVLFQRLSNAQKRLWIIKDATHPLMQEFCKEDLFRKTLDFLNEVSFDGGS